MRNWVRQGGSRYRPLCDLYRSLYGAQSQFDTELSAAVQEPSSVAMQLMSSALRHAVPSWHGTECSCEGAVIGRFAAIDVLRSTARNPTLTWNWVQLWRSRHRSLCSNCCRPIYGAQSHLDTELSAAVKKPSSVAMQQCSYACGCRFC
jgi:hypothetical protein